MEFVEPVFDVRQQEMFDLRFAVIEQFGIPVGLLAGRTGKRIMVIGPVQFVETFVDILDIMRLHQVHHYRKPQFMCPFDQRFQIFRRPETGRRGEKIADMVAETAVIGMLGHSHQLNDIVTVLLDAGQNRPGEFGIGPHPLLLLAHAHMALINIKAAQRRDIEAVAVPVERFGRRPQLSRKILALLVLNDTANIGRNPLEPAIPAVDQYLDPRTVHQSPRKRFIGQKNRPHTSGTPSQRQFRTLPAVEIPEQVDIDGTRQPLAEPPPPADGIVLEPEIEVTVGIIDQRTCRALDAGKPPAKMRIALRHGPFDRFEPVVLFHNREAPGQLCLHIRPVLLISSLPDFDQPACCFQPGPEEKSELKNNTYFPKRQNKKDSYLCGAKKF